MTLVGDSAAGHDRNQYDEESVGDIDSKSTSPEFFEWDRHWKGDRDSFAFTPMTFNHASLPLGDSQRFCLGLQHTNHTDGRTDVRNDQVVKGFDQCYGAIKGHGRWQDDFPLVGLNFQTWTQVRRRVPAGEDDCSGTGEDFQYSRTD